MDDESSLPEAGDAHISADVLNITRITTHDQGRQSPGRLFDNRAEQCLGSIGAADSNGTIVRGNFEEGHWQVAPDHTDRLDSHGVTPWPVKKPGQIYGAT